MINIINHYLNYVTLSGTVKVRNEIVLYTTCIRKDIKPMVHIYIHIQIQAERGEYKYGKTLISF